MCKLVSIFRLITLPPGSPAVGENNIWRLDAVNITSLNEI